jgi:hypothetical protein
VAAPVAEAFFGMTKVMLAEGVQNSKNGREFTGGGRQCWVLVLKCYESRTRQHNVKCKYPSSFEALFPLGYNEFRTKVMKEKTFVSSIDDKEECVYEIRIIIQILPSTYFYFHYHIHNNKL